MESLKIVDSYRENLMVNKRVLAHLEQRGINEDCIKQYNLGYCPPFSHPTFTMLRGRIVVPIYDLYGQFIAFAGRIYEPMAEEVSNFFWSTTDNHQIAFDNIKKWKSAKWWNEVYPKKMHLFNFNNAKEEARLKDYIVVVEGYFDAIVLSMCGIKNVVCLSSLTISPQHCIKIKRYTNNVICLLDGDDKGDNAKHNTAEIISRYELNPIILSLPLDYDPDDFALQYGANRITKSIDFLLNNGKSQGDFSTDGDKIKLINIR